MGGGAGRIQKSGTALQILEHLLVLFAGFHARNAQRDDLDAAQFAPLGRKLLIERVGQLGGVAGQGRVADAHRADPGKRRLQGGHQLGLQLAVQCVAGVGVFHIAADVGVKQDGVGDPVAVLAKAPHADVNVDAGARIHDPEGNGAGRAVFAAHQLLGVDVIHPLVGGGLPAEGEPLADLGKHFVDVGGQPLAGKEGGLSAGAVGVRARFRAEIHHLALLDDEGALPLGNGDHRAVGDDVVPAMTVGRAARGALFTPDGEDLRRERVARKKFFPLIGHHAGCCRNSSFDKTHKSDLLCFTACRRCGFG